MRTSFMPGLHGYISRVHDAQIEPSAKQLATFKDVVQDGNQLFFKNAPSIRVTITPRKNGYLCDSSWGLARDAKNMDEALRKGRDLLRTWEEAIEE